MRSKVQDWSAELNAYTLVPRPSVLPGLVVSRDRRSLQVPEGIWAITTECSFSHSYRQAGCGQSVGVGGVFV